MFAFFDITSKYERKMQKPPFWFYLLSLLQYSKNNIQYWRSPNGCLQWSTVHYPNTSPYQNSTNTVYRLWYYHTDINTNKSLSLGDGREVDAFFSPEFYLSCYCYPGGHPVKCVKRVHGLLRLWQNYDNKVGVPHTSENCCSWSMWKIMYWCRHNCLLNNVLICRVLLY